MSTETARSTEAAGAPAAAPQAVGIARTLFPHQVEGVAFLIRRRRAILADDMGLGKTRQAIVALRTEEPNGRYLGICPASVAGSAGRGRAAGSSAACR
jgi:SNF2 family DNA or RNA helicase